MGAISNIEWTDATWNPIRGCTPVSPGCKNCYAASVAKRFSFVGGPYEGLVRINAAGERTDDWNGQIKFVEEHLLDPLKWKPVKEHLSECTSATQIEHGFKIPCRCPTRPRRIFVNSMSDLFHDNVTDEMCDKIFAVMALCPKHEFQVLTKRPERMLEYMESRAKSIKYWQSAARELGYTLKFDGMDGTEHSLCPFPLPNVWLGVSVENQKAADERIPLLLRTPAAVRFISAEPLLEGVLLRRLPWTDGKVIDPLSGIAWTPGQPISGWPMPSHLLHWVIVGGESGVKARPMMSRWADSIREQCEAAGTAFFFKQNGQWIDAGHDEFGKLPTGEMKALKSDGTQWGVDDVPDDEDADVTTMKRVTRERAGHTLYGKMYHAFPK